MHYAAGILPVTWHDGKALFLVGQDVRDRCWSDFGGKVERVDKNDPLNTATRELWEETYGCMVDARVLRDQLSPDNCIALKSRTQNNHPYWMFIVEVPYVPHLRNTFRKLVAFLRHKSACKGLIEKVDVQWVTWDMLKASAATQRPVFHHTLAHNSGVLSRIASGSQDWPSLCSELAPAHTFPLGDA